MGSIGRMDYSRWTMAALHVGKEGTTIIVIKQAVCCITFVPVLLEEAYKRWHVQCPTQTSDCVNVWSSVYAQPPTQSEPAQHC